jgi:hypothetical protein
MMKISAIIAHLRGSCGKKGQTFSEGGFLGSINICRAERRGSCRVVDCWLQFGITNRDDGSAQGDRPIANHCTNRNTRAFKRARATDCRAD